MLALLMVLFFLVSFCLVVVVLLQSGKGGGLAAGFGGAGTGFELLGGRQTASFLHRATMWLGGAFLAVAFVIAILTARGSRPGSLGRELQGQPAPVQQESGTPQDLQSVVGKGGGQQGAGANQPGQAGGTGGQAPPAASRPSGPPPAQAPPAAGGAPAPAPAPGTRP
jgi:preprotein translocase subunit SecG